MSGLALLGGLVWLGLFRFDLLLWRINLLRLMFLALVSLVIRLDVVPLPSFIFTLVGRPAGNNRLNELIDFHFGRLMCFAFGLFQIWAGLLFLHLRSLGCFSSS